MDMSFPSATLVISDSVAKRHQGFDPEEQGCHDYAKDEANLE
jgi:uncharacterized protein YdhG (YjbR/CyaY superfamily)